MQELIEEMKHRIGTLEHHIEYSKGQRQHHLEQAAIYAEEIEADEKLAAQYSEALTQLEAPTL